MEQWNLSVCMTNEEVNLQIVFPLLSMQRFVSASRRCSIQYVVDELMKLDSALNCCMDTDSPWVFDAQGNLLDVSQTLECFEEQQWIQLFVC